MKLIRLSISLVLLCMLAVACSSEGGKQATNPADKDGDKGELSEPKSFIEQNKEYTKTLIATILQEKPDQRVLELLQQEKNGAADSLTSVERELNISQRKLVQLRKELQELEDRSSGSGSLQSDLLDEKRENRGKIRRLNNEIDNLESDIQVVESDLSDSNRKKNNLSQQKNTLENQKQNKQNRLANQRQRKQELQGDIQRNKTRIDNLKAKNEQLREKKRNETDPGERARLQTKIDSNKNKIQNMKQDNQAKRNQLDNVENRIARLKSEIQDINVALMSKQQEIDQVNRQIVDLRTQRDGYRDQKDRKEDRKDRLASRNVQIDREIASLDGLPGDIADKKAEIQAEEVVEQRLIAEKDVAQNTYNVASKNHADFSAGLVTKMEVMWKAEELNDEALAIFYDEAT